MNCRHCGSLLSAKVIDLASAPPSNGYLTTSDLSAPERWYPLRVLVCTQCWLMQTDDFARFDDLFDANYAYFSGYSTTWLSHSKSYADMACERFALDAKSRVVEIASNDGYLLQYFRAKGVPCLGIEPTSSTANAARAKGLEVVGRFFGNDLAQELSTKGMVADLVIANNVLAHVPDINDFVRGVTTILADSGVATFEFAYAVPLMERGLFDTIYHEHFSYLSATAVDAIFSKHGLQIFDVEVLSTHGGSLRIYAQRAGEGGRYKMPAVQELLRREKSGGVTDLSFYASLQARAELIKDEFLQFLLDSKRLGCKVAAYGAAAKGNTLLNFAGVRGDLIRFVADRNPAKQGKFLPGSRIPVVSEEVLRAERPDFVVVLPWNLREEIHSQLAYLSSWNGKIVTVLPQLEISDCVLQ